MHRDKLRQLGLHSSLGLDSSHKAWSRGLGYPQRCSLLEEFMTGLSDDLAIVLEQDSGKVVDRLLALLEQTFGRDTSTTR